MRVKMKNYPDRVCPTCGKSFKPNHARQVYDSHYCRTKANRAAKKELEKPPEVNFMLEQIRRIDAESALELEQVAKELGMRYAERMILIGYRLANRGAIIHARNVLLEAGEIAPKKQRIKA